jgi:2-haloacid dehalogenase
MTIRTRPLVAVFDVVETLASLDAVAARLRQHGLDGVDLVAWFTRVLRDGMALTAAGGYAGFAEVAASALTAHTRGTLADAQIEDVLTGFGELTAQPDAAAAVRAALEAEMRVFALTNGAAETTRSFLERAGLAADVDAVLSIDEVRAWKPHPAVYRYAIATAEEPANRIALLSVHSWDIFGARQAGMTTGWCPQLEGVPTAAFGAADVVANSLDAVVRALASLPRRPT